MGLAHIKKKCTGCIGAGTKGAHESFFPPMKLIFLSLNPESNRTLVFLSRCREQINIGLGPKPDDARHFFVRQKKSYMDAVFVPKLFYFVWLIWCKENISLVECRSRFLSLFFELVVILQRCSGFGLGSIAVFFTATSNALSTNWS